MKQPALIRAFSSFAKVVKATLQEIFDESAYRRFLERTQQKSSVEAYALFAEENNQSKLRRPKCC